MGENKLYINEGNWTFKDVTIISGTAGRSGPWKTGVAMVDINGDHRLDIYVCYSGALPDHKRTNQFFINQGTNDQGTPIFEDKAAEYGLDSKAFSNQAYFFDYDRDGDLDMLLLNHNPKSLPVLNEVRTAKMLQQDDPLKGVRLFRQEDGKFQDVTRQAGISGSALTYGLGIGIADLNKDEWPDFYVSNDYTVPDYLYINNQNGSFSNKLNTSVRYNSQFSMGNDVADINNDTWPDIITLDMLPEDNHRQKLLMAPDNYAKFDLNVRSGFHYQYMRNMLQLNNGNGTFTEIGQLAGISNTDWSWAALATDFDNDGWKDLYITNGYHRDYTNLDFIKYMDDYVQSKGRLKREDVVGLINKMPASDLVNYMFANKEGSSFNKVTKAWGLDQIANSNGAAYADLDNDGDLDLIVNNINKPAFIYENKANNSENHFLQIKLTGEGLNTNGLGASISLYHENKIQYQEQFPVRGYLSAISPVLHFGLGSSTYVDSLIVKWPGGKQQKLLNINADQRISLEEKNAVNLENKQNTYETIFSAIPSVIPYQHPKQTARDFDRQPLLISELSHQGPCMVQADFNKDQLPDLLIGGSRGQSATLFLQLKKGQFKSVPNPVFDKDKNTEDTAIATLDANGDGHLDVYITSGGYHPYKVDDPLLQDPALPERWSRLFFKKYKCLTHMESKQFNCSY